jgi:hypothetical protein
MVTIREIWAAYELARGRWSGCNWPTRFGSLGLDLKGVSSLRARGAAQRWRALAADESGRCATCREDSDLITMALYQRLHSPAVRPAGGGLTLPELALRPTRRRCAEALAEEWELAACILALIEADARRAERAARAAVRAAEASDWGRAHRYARRASKLESGYDAPRLWGRLEALIEAAAGRDVDDGRPQGPRSESDRGTTVTTRQREQDRADQQGRDKLDSLIAAAVLRALGRPDHLRAVQVRRVSGESYRVNVFTGDDLSATIAHSYFLTTDEAGEILEASPKIVKQY